MVSMRSISQLDIVQVMLDRLKNSEASDWNHFYEQEKRTTFEFDYHNNLVPSFPGIIAPLEELWTSWVMKTMALKPTYISMLRGRA